MFSFHSTRSLDRSACTRTTGMHIWSTSGHLLLRFKTSIRGIARFHELWRSSEGRNARFGSGAFLHGVPPGKDHSSLANPHLDGKKKQQKLGFGGYWVQHQRHMPNWNELEPTTNSSLWSTVVHVEKRLDHLKWPQSLCDKRDVEATFRFRHNQIPSVADWSKDRWVKSHPREDAPRDRTLSEEVEAI